MTRTLLSLIQSNDFSEYKRHSDLYNISGEVIEDALYGNNSSGVINLDHEEAFFDAVDCELFDISTWLCTDTHVGLQIMRMNGLPVATVWQSARKDDIEVLFLTPYAFEKFRAAWEAHRPEPECQSAIIDDSSLNMPIAAPGEKQYDIAGYTEGMQLSLSPFGVVTWIEGLKDQGGIASISNVGVLTHALISLDGRINSHEAFMRQIKEMPPERQDLPGLSPLMEEVEVVREVREEIARQLAKISDKPVPPVTAKTDMAPDAEK